MKFGVAVILEDENGRVLLSKRGKLARNEIGKWESIGGEVEKGETKEEAIIRECLEEIGAQLAITGIAYESIVEFEGDSWSMTIFRGNLLNKPKIQDPNFTSELVWFKKEEIVSLPLASYSRADFEKLGWLKK